MEDNNIEDTLLVWWKPRAQRGVGWGEGKSKLALGYCRSRNYSGLPFPFLSACPAPLHASKTNLNPISPYKAFSSLSPFSHLTFY